MLTGSSHSFFVWSCGWFITWWWHLFSILEQNIFLDPGCTGSQLCCTALPLCTAHCRFSVCPGWGSHGLEHASRKCWRFERAASWVTSPAESAHSPASASYRPRGSLWWQFELRNKKHENSVYVPVSFSQTDYFNYIITMILKIWPRNPWQTSNWSVILWLYF